jgi:hypothetical protein
MRWCQTCCVGQWAKRFRKAPQYTATTRVNRAVRCAAKYKATILPEALQTFKKWKVLKSISKRTEALETARDVQQGNDGCLRM